MDVKGDCIAFCSQLPKGFCKGKGDKRFILHRTIKKTWNCYSTPLKTSHCFRQIKKWIFDSRFAQFRDWKESEIWDWICNLGIKPFCLCKLCDIVSSDSNQWQRWFTMTINDNFWFRKLDITHRQPKLSLVYSRRL